MSHSLPARAALAALVATTALAAAAPVASAKSKSCTRGGAKLEAAAGKVRVVSRPLKLRMQETRREALMACWTSTGRRKTILVEQDVGLDLITRTKIEIVDDRYVGLDVDFEGGASESTTAAVWDAKTRKRVHTSHRCDIVDRGDFSGPDDVEFLPHGGLAFSCGKLLLFKRAKTATAQQLEPASADVKQIGLSVGAHGFSTVLYWTLGDDTIKSLDLGV
jgi:hypothetical protein